VGERTIRSSCRFQPIPASLVFRQRVAPQKQLTRPAEHSEATHRLPQILTGGEHVLFTAAGPAAVFPEDWNIEVLSLKTGQTKTVVRGGFHGRYLPSGH